MAAIRSRRWHVSRGPSLGSVFFGAMTCIGNGPDFMGKSITDSAKVKTPTFVGHVLKFSLPVLLPILLFRGWWFFWPRPA